MVKTAAWAIANVWVNVHYGIAGGKLPVCEKLIALDLERNKAAASYG